MKKFRVNGMTCSACVARVEKVVKSVDGVEDCVVSLLTNSMTVEGSFSEKEVIKRVTDAGYTAEIQRNIELDDGRETKNLKKRLFSSITLLILLMYISMGYVMWSAPLPVFLAENPLIIAILQFVLCVIVLFINRKFFIVGYKSLFKLSPNMDTLVALSSTAALVYSVIGTVNMAINASSAHIYLHDMYYETSAMIVTLITIGKTLESYSKGKTTSALRSLINLAPKTATILVDGEEKEVKIEDVKVGDLFVVKSGYSIPVDGVVEKGSGAVNESALTGESVPVDKDIGDNVSAGTVFLTGYMVCKAQRVGEDTTLSKIIQLVEGASATKAPIAKLADKVSGIFVPSVIAVALVTFLVWIISNSAVGYALQRAIAVLVISCPCALGLATPVAIVVGSGKGAKKGILFKTAESLELAGLLDVVVLDKTGTVTKGEPVVTDVVTAKGVEEEELVQTAYSLEKLSEHPLSKAVVEYAKGKEEKPVTDFLVLAGNGLSGKIDDVAVVAGNEKFIKQQANIPEELQNRAKELSLSGKTPMYFAKGDRVLGIIAVADEIKEDSATAVQDLKKMGIKVVMLTGDNEIVANAIAKSAGIDEVVAGVLPDKKAEVVQKLKATGKVAMVGDGINDAPALTSADVGIAIGAGSDVAIESASVVLVKNDLSSVASAVRLGRRVRRNIKQNLFWAFIYNTLGIPLAAGVFIPLFGLELNPMIGAAAMSLSSVCVVTNALRLNLFDPDSNAHDKPHRHARRKKARTEENQSITSQESMDGLTKSCRENTPEPCYIPKPTTIVGKREIKTQKENTNMTKILKVDGMMCMHCVARVKKILEAIDGVESATVDLDTKTATVTLTHDLPDATLTTPLSADGYPVLEIK